MRFDVPINTTDIIVLIILAIFMIIGVRIVIGFFKEPKSTKKKADEE